jgi:hypothetical protein
MVMRKYWLVLVFTHLVASFGCSQNTDIEDWFRIENPATQRSIVVELEKRGIASHVDKDNRVWFPAERQVTVHKIAFKLMENAESGHETFTFTKPEYTNMLMARLRAANIYFGAQVEKGVTCVVLDSFDRTEWEPLKRGVEALFVAKNHGPLYAAQK